LFPKEAVAAGFRSLHSALYMGTDTRPLGVAEEFTFVEAHIVLVVRCARCYETGISLPAMVIAILRTVRCVRFRSHLLLPTMIERSPIHAVQENIPVSHRK
jgi:hypothetical protein